MVVPIVCVKSYVLAGGIRKAEIEPTIPQDVGIWLETDWYRKQAVIKEIRKDSYAFTSTDVHVRRD